MTTISRKIGGTEITDILNVSVDDSTWTAIDMAADTQCTSVALKLRSGSAFKISHVSDGATYYTVDSSIALDIMRHSESTICYVQTSSGNDTLEALMIV